MADISKCFGKGCALKEICYRYTCKGDDLYQSYILADESLKPGETHCDMFWPDKQYVEDKNESKRVHGKRKRKTTARKSCSEKHAK